MQPTRDRAEIVHFAGRHRLSPALHEGGPELVALGDQGGRCGWELFFRAMESRALALETDAEGAFRFVPEAKARPGSARPAAALSEARRFLAALRA